MGELEFVERLAGGHVGGVVSTGWILRISVCGGGNVVVFAAN